MNPQLFVDDVSADLTCPICLFIVLEPIEHSICGQLICSSCSESHQDCPKCEQPLVDKKISMRSFPYEVYKALLIRCQYKGCTEICPWPDKEKHESNCTVCRKAVYAVYAVKKPLPEIIGSELTAFVLDDDHLKITQQKLGQGSFGEVFLGYLNATPTAIKCMKINRPYDVITEIHIMNKLESHDKLLTIYGVTLFDTTVNVVLELAAFRSLSDVIEKRDLIPDLPPSLTIAWLCDLADALKYIHSKQIKHNDIKAQNILAFRSFQIKLGDFGCANEQSNEPDTTSSTPFGTLSFMAPEVRHNQGATLSSDLYSFGITSLQIMTRKVPSHCPQDQRVKEIRDAVVELALPCMSNDLLTLLLRCVERDPSQRPSSEELHNVCMNILQSNDCDPRLDGTVVPLDKKVQKSEIFRDKRVFDAQKSLQSQSTIQKGLSSSSSNTLKYEISSDMKGNLKTVFNFKCIATMADHAATVYALVLSKHDSILYSGSADCTIKVWNLLTYQCMVTLEGHSKTVSAVVLYHAKRRLISASLDRTIKVWDTETWQCLHTLKGHSDGVTALVIDEKIHRLYSASWDKIIKVWDLHTLACMETLTGHSGYIYCLCLSSTSNRLYSGANDNTVRAWDTVSMTCDAIFEGHTSWVMSLCLSEDGKRLYSGSQDKTIKEWDTTTNKVVGTLHGHSSTIMSLDYLSKPNVLISGSDDKSIKVWDISIRRCIYTIEAAHSSWINSLVLCSDSIILYSASNDKTIKVWSLT